MIDALLFVHRVDNRLLIRAQPILPDYPPPPPTTYYRVSPIFKVRPEIDVDVDFSGRISVGFYILDHAYTVVAELAARLPTAMPYLWFSHGLASLVVLTPDEGLLDEIDAIVEPRHLASERWKVASGEIIDQQQRLSPAPELRPDEFELPDYSALPEDLRIVVKEFAHSLNKAVFLSNQFLPSERHTYAMLRLAAHDMISQLIALHTPAESTDLPLGSAQPEEFAKDHLIDRKTLHQLVDRLVQINSALSYLMSQSFAGVVPILQRECLIRNYSLLGVGTAIAGVTALARFIERVFENNPIDLVIEKEFSKLEKLEGYFSFGAYDVSGWREPWRGVDEYLEGLPTEPHVPKLMYFSGRLGFREAEFSVSAALQVLSGANTVGWSLMTLSHELLHGHVRELLSAILTFDSDQATLTQFRALFAQYELARDGRSETRVTQLDSLRFVIFRYCEQVSINGSLTRTPAFQRRADGKLNAREPQFPADLVRDILESEYRNISEIMVHVLDFFYFYNAQPQIYLPFVWESWSQVPSVLKNLEHYLLRSITTIASIQSGNGPERFLAASAIVRGQIGIAADRNPQNELLREAFSMMSDTQRLEQMRLPFYASLLIADLTANILRARSLHADLLGDDPNLDVAPSGWVYRIRPDTFIDETVHSPTGFLLGLLSEALNTNSGEASQRLAAWVFLALASSSSLKGR